VVQHLVAEAQRHVAGERDVALDAQLAGDVRPVPSSNSTKRQAPSVSDRQRELLAMTGLGQRILETEKAK